MDSVEKIAENQQDTVIVRPDKASAPKVTTLQDLDNLAERIGQAWQSEKSAVEILSEMRR